MNILLTGLRGTGKTTIGKLLATKLNRLFLDMDAEIEKEQGKKIAQIVKKNGWDYFRNLEHKMTKKIAKLDNYIISTGGGTLIFDRNIKLLKKNSFIILLTAEIKTLAKRIQKNKNRPSLTGKNFIQELNEVWEERKEKYEKVADVVVKTGGKDPEKVIDEIFKILNYHIKLAP